MTYTWWPLLIMVAFGTLLAIALAAGSRRRRRIGRCPLNANTVVVETQESLWTGTTVDVLSCSEFTPRTAVRCGKRCVREGLG